MSRKAASRRLAGCDRWSPRRILLRSASRALLGRAPSVGRHIASPTAGALGSAEQLERREAEHLPPACAAGAEYGQFWRESKALKTFPCYEGWRGHKLGPYKSFLTRAGG